MILSTLSKRNFRFQLKPSYTKKSKIIQKKYYTTKHYSSLPDKIQDALNDHINAEYAASYVYLHFSTHFNRLDVSLPGFTKYFLSQSEEELLHSKMMMDYLNKRGGVVRLGPIPQPPTDIVTPLKIFEKALEMEEEIYDKLINLHRIGEEFNDPNLCDFIEGTFLAEQVNAVKEVSDLVVNLRRVSDSGLGLFLFDKQLQGTLTTQDTQGILNN